MSASGDKANGLQLDTSNSESVAKHYNKLQEIGLQKRTETSIYYLRNFNNWVKSCLISTTVDAIKAEREQKSREPEAELEKSSKLQNENGSSEPSPKAAKTSEISSLGSQRNDPGSLGSFQRNDQDDGYSHPSLEDGPPRSNDSGSRKRNSFHMTEQKDRFVSKRERLGDFRVLDLCCGKGGDLLKWSKCEIPVTSLVGVDIADVSIKQCRDRFWDMKKKKNKLVDDKISVHVL